MIQAFTNLIEDVGSPELSPGTGCARDRGLPASLEPLPVLLHTKADLGGKVEAGGGHKHRVSPQQHAQDTHQGASMKYL